MVNPRPDPAHARTGLGSRAWLPAVLCLAALPSIGTLGAPWIAEDASILGRVARSGALGDWIGPQYGLRLAAFWRPVVTLSWWLQELVGGTDVLFLRGLNLALHAALAAVSGLVVRRLTRSVPAAWLAGSLIAVFPFQGGTVTWLAGRTDLLASFWMVLTLYAVQRRAVLSSVLFAFLACASKESAFVLPVWVAALLWAEVPSEGAASEAGSRWRRWLPVALTVAIAFLWRRLALGVWVGGYSGSSAGMFDSLGSLVTAYRTLGDASLGMIAGGVGLALVAASVRGLDNRLFVFGLVCGGISLAPLVPLAVDGFLEPQNTRLLYTAEIGFAIAAAAAFARRPQLGSLAWLLWSLGFLLVGLRAVDAWRDTHEWARAANDGEQAIARAREIVAHAEPSKRPVLVTGFPTSAGGAYCLNWGVADRFRAPFEPTPRPVWPLRQVFGLANGERAPIAPVRPDGSVWPWSDRPASVSLLAVELVGGAIEAGIVLDETVLMGVDRPSPRFAIALPIDGSVARLEGLVYTELGYEAADLGHTLSLRQILATFNGVATLGQTLMQASDVGARYGYLELRALAPDGTVVSASDWIELSWGDELLGRALGD